MTPYISLPLELADWVSHAMMTFMFLYLSAGKFEEIPPEIRIALQYFPWIVFVQMLAMWPIMALGLMALWVFELLEFMGISLDVFDEDE